MRGLMLFSPRTFPDGLFRTVIQGEVNLIIVSEIYIENIINIMKQKQIDSLIY